MSEFGGQWPQQQISPCANTNNSVSLHHVEVRHYTREEEEEEEKEDANRNTCACCLSHMQFSIIQTCCSLPKDLHHPDVNL